MYMFIVLFLVVYLLQFILNGQKLRLRELRSGQNCWAVPDSKSGSGRQNCSAVPNSELGKGRQNGSAMPGSESDIGQFSEAGLLEWMRFVIFHARSRKQSQHTSRPISE